MRDHTHKLSKRDGDASYEDFIKKGYLKEAIINYIALLGWSPQGDREKYTLSELAEVFSVEGISKSPAIFDENKLAWLNGEYIKGAYTEQFHEKAKPYYEDIITKPEIDTKKSVRFCRKEPKSFRISRSRLTFLRSFPSMTTLCLFIKNENKRGKFKNRFACRKGAF